MKNIPSQNGLESWETAEREVQPIHPVKSDHEGHRKYCDGSLAQKARSTTSSPGGSRSSRSGKAFRKNGCRTRSSQQYLPSEHREALSEHVGLYADKLDSCKKNKQCAIDSVIKNTGLVPMHVGALMKDNGRGKASKGGKGNKGSGKVRSRRHNRRGSAKQAQCRERRSRSTRSSERPRCWRSANYEDFASKFTAHVAQQDEAPADELEKFEKPDVPPAPHSSLTPEIMETSKKVQDRTKDNSPDRTHCRVGRHRPQDRLKHSDRSVRIRHGARCPLMLRTAGFSLRKMAGA